MPVTRAALQSELQNDPAALGYAPLLAAGRYGELVDVLNEQRNGITVARDAVPAWEFTNAIEATDYATLTPELRAYFSFVVAAGQVVVSGGAVRAAMRDAFPNGSASKTNLRALWDRRASRAEFLFGQSVTLEDCVRAIRGSF